VAQKVLDSEHGCRECHHTISHLLAAGGIGHLFFSCLALAHLGFNRIVVLHIAVVWLSRWRPWFCCWYTSELSGSDAQLEIRVAAWLPGSRLVQQGCLGWFLFCFRWNVTPAWSPTWSGQESHLRWHAY
jgi:hypothetical protein